MAWLRQFAALLVAVLMLGSPQVSWASTVTTPAATSPELITSVRLPMARAEALAHSALLACRTRDAAVSVTVVDAQGVPQVVLRDDEAAPHSLELSRQKAYTAVSLAALQQLHTTSELVEGLTRQPLATGDLALPSAPVAGITPLPGGVVVRWQGHLLAGLGVSGARQGLVDEACALEAEAALQRQLEQPPPA
jgi:uncharacterized protein GlcG (DUF336 family)